MEIMQPDQSSAQTPIWNMNYSVKVKSSGTDSSKQFDKNRLVAPKAPILMGKITEETFNSRVSSQKSQENIRSKI